MPKVRYTAAKGLFQESGSGWQISDVALLPSVSTVTLGSVTIYTHTSGSENVLALDYSGASGAVTDFEITDGSSIGQELLVVFTAVKAVNITFKNTDNSNIVALTTPAANTAVQFVWTGSKWANLA